MTGVSEATDQRTEIDDELAGTGIARLVHDPDFRGDVEVERLREQDLQVVLIVRIIRQASNGELIRRRQGPR